MPVLEKELLRKVLRYGRARDRAVARKTMKARRKFVQVEIDLLTTVLAVYDKQKGKKCS